MGLRGPNRNWEICSGKNEFTDQDVREAVAILSKEDLAGYREEQKRGFRYIKRNGEPWHGRIVQLK